MRTPEKRRSLQVSEAVWARLKQRALDERVTVREVVERAVHQYLAGSGIGPAGPTVPHVRTVGPRLTARTLREIGDEPERVVPDEHIP